MAGSRAIKTPLAYEIGKDAETTGRIYAGEQGIASIGMDPKTYKANLDKYRELQDILNGSLERQIYR